MNVVVYLLLALNQANPLAYLFYRFQIRPRTLHRFFANLSDKQINKLKIDFFFQNVDYNTSIAY